MNKGIDDIGFYARSIFPYSLYLPASKLANPKQDKDFGHPYPAKLLTYNYYDTAKRS